jgi:S1-C subfamily serine protease
MNRYILFLISAVVLSSSCTGPGIRTVQYSNSGNSKGENCQVDVFREGRPIDKEFKVLGEISAYDTGFSARCGEYDIVKIMKDKACFYGADAIQIYDVREPDFFGSTCWRAKARFLAYVNADINKKDPPKSTGTAWLSEYGYIVTNNHVVADRTNINLIDHQGRKISARVLTTDPINDIALLIADLDNTYLGLQVANSPSKLGASVFTIGYPHPDIMGSSAKLSSGTISSISGIRNDVRTYQVSMPIQLGNSGGPLFNNHGEVVGIVFSKLSAASLFKWTGDLPENVSYAVKSTYLTALITSIDSHQGKVDSIRPMRGTLEEIAEEVKKSVFMVIAEK